jgi:2-keto-4-pentenoate hydratase/2-oxohepta-3-ene-1,7-dioic acid hydratase in catechol pathway
LRLASYMLGGKPSYGVVMDAGIADVGSEYRGRFATLRELLAWRSGMELLSDRDHKADLALEEVRFLPVIPDSGAIFCVGLNYADHARETGRPLPTYPSTFLKLNRSLVGHCEALTRPCVSDSFDWEAELGVVIGRPARHVEESDALSFVAGYTCLNDGSIRNWQHSRDVTQGKNFLGSGACGPWLVTRDEIPDPGSLTVASRLNGVEMQRATTDNLIFSVPRLVSYYSTLTELRPGDIISTGTPGGVGHRREPKIYMRPGDVIEVEISRIGLLRNPVVDEASAGAAGAASERSRARAE